MPHYYIDTDDGERLVVDEDGHDLADAEAARRLALTNLPEMAGDAIPDGDRRTFSVRVRDANGTVIFHAELDLVGEWQVSSN